MKVLRLIELLEKEDPEAQVVRRVEHLLFPVVRLVERQLTPTKIRNMHSNQLHPGFKNATEPDEARLCIEAQY